MREKLKYWIGFNRIAGIGAARLQKLISTFGDVEKAWKASPLELSAAGYNAAWVRKFVQKRHRVDLEILLKKTFDTISTIYIHGEQGYPRRLAEIDNPPPVLFSIGEIIDADQFAVAIVGSRKPTSYGKRVAQDLAAALALNGVTVISGLARGIDAIAHRSALEAGGRTLAVLGSSLDQIYPPEHGRLAESISRAGAVVSDYPLGTRPEAKNFPPRNRIIAGLALGVVIIEAGRRSGALITARFAAEQGREVFVVPGSIYNPNLEGSHNLILQGANLFSSIAAFMLSMNFEMVRLQDEASDYLPLSAEEQRILSELSRTPIHINELGIRCKLSSGNLAAQLVLLAMKGRVKELGSMNYIRLK